ncbi:MAG: VCBS repeat-containing protein, partial [Firmicutes bacterium]|nr:VCBS repeat-containing protein [Bacillota bacterium]
MIHPLRLALLPASALVLALGCHSDSDYQGGNGFVTQAVAVADLDGTGGLDVLSVNDRYVDGNRVSGFLTTRLQKAGAPGTFVDPLRVDSGAYPLALAVGDLNGDGRPDVAVAAFLATSG